MCRDLPEHKDSPPDCSRCPAGPALEDEQALKAGLSEFARLSWDLYCLWFDQLAQDFGAGWPKIKMTRDQAWNLRRHLGAIHSAVVKARREMEEKKRKRRKRGG